MTSSSQTLSLLAIAVFLVAAKTADVTYPKAPTAKVVEDYHGTQVADPYRPLENPDAPETRAWIEAENRLTDAYLAKVPGRGAINKRLTTLWNYEKYSVPFKEGGRYFFRKNDGLQNQAPLYVLDRLDGTPRLLLDPNTLSKDGTVALTTTAVSRDGRKMVYGLAAAGSDWNEFKVLDVDTGKDLPDHLQWIKFSDASWLPDGSGFYYSRFDAPAAGAELQDVNKNQKVYFHKLGTKQAEDPLVYERPDDPELGFAAVVTDDGKYLVLFVWKGTDRRNRLYFKDLTRPGSEVDRLFDAFDAGWQLIDNVGSVFYLKTDKDAPRSRVVSIDVSLPAADRKLKEVVPESDLVISSATIVGDRLILQVLKDASDHARIHTLDGKLEKEVPLPTVGSLQGFGGHRTDAETFYGFTSFTYPFVVYRYDFTSGKSEVFRQPKLSFDPADFEASQVFYPSKDGTKIPLFLVHKKGLKKDGNAPVYLYGYGGFNANMTPAFSTQRLVFMEMGGVYAQACLRGGAEYGEAWHEAGMLGNKQNVFDDFAWAAKWLVAGKWSSPKRISIHGGSNGGLLVGATLNQHPELFGAAVPAVGVMDMLRFHKWTIGWAWVSDYGSSEKPDQFKWLYAYSPLHNVRKGTKYPPVMIVTGDHDDRVVPAHSFKYAAAMQAAQAGDAPILIRIETRAGHGAGKPTSKQIEESTDVLAFLVKTLGGLTPPKG